MKKTLVITLVSVCMLTACGKAYDESIDETVQITSQESTTEIGDINTTQETTQSSETTLIAYFSRVGNTNFDAGVDAVSSASINGDNGNFTGNAQILAGYAHEATGGDIFLIETVDKYPSDYSETTNVANTEKSNNARPELASRVDNFDSYDKIVLIYPNWWGTIPMPVATFLENYDFTGKTIIPICTHEGSAMGSSVSDIKKLAPNAEVVSGLDVRGGRVGSAKDEVEKFLAAN
jgi:flavodoxin